MAVMTIRETGQQTARNSKINLPKTNAQTLYCFPNPNQAPVISILRADSYPEVTDLLRLPLPTLKHKSIYSTRDSSSWR